MKQFSNLSELLSDITGKGVSCVNKKDENERGGASSSENVQVIFEDGSEKKIFLKTRKSGSHIEGIDKVLGLYGREIVMYREVLPLLDKFVQDHSKNGDGNGEKFMDIFPKFYGAGEINGDLILVFEDILDGTGRFVTEKNVMCKKEFYHSTKQIIVTLENLARFHAISACYQSETKQDLGELFPELSKTFLNPDRVELLKPFFQGIFLKHLRLIQVLVRAFHSGNSTLRSHLSPTTVKEANVVSLISTGDTLLENFYEMLTTEVGGPKVLCHGDFHMWNIAYRGEKSNPEDFLLFDLQVCNTEVRSGAADLVQYLAQVTSPAEFRKTAAEDSLKAYCESFNSTLDKMGSGKTNVKYCTVEFLREEMQRLRLWGAMFAINFIIERFVQNKEEFDKITESMLIENTADADERIVQILHKSGQNIWEAVDIMLEHVAETQMLKTC